MIIVIPGWSFLSTNVKTLKTRRYPFILGCLSFHLVATTPIRTSESDFARTNTAVYKTVAEDKVQGAVGTAVAHVVVALEKHVIHMNHGSENVGLLLRGYILVVKVHFVNVRIRKQLASRRTQTLGLDFFDRGKVTKGELMNRLEVGIGSHDGNAKIRAATQLGATAKKARTPRRGKHAGGGTRRAVTVHDLQHGLESTTGNGLHRFANQKCRFARASRLAGSGAGNISRIKRSLVGTAGGAGKAAQERFGTGAGEAAVAAFALECHDR